MKRRVYIASDHAGFTLKQSLTAFYEKKVKFIDLTPKFEKCDDYPKIAFLAAKQVVKSKGLGLLVCGSGQGMCIAANKVKGVRAAQIWNVKTAKLAREEDNVNIACIGQRVTSKKDALSASLTFLNSKFKRKTRYARRVQLIKEFEK